jgi:autotransporter-associated beta strand protein
MKNQCNNLMGNWTRTFAGSLRGKWASPAKRLAAILGLATGVAFVLAGSSANAQAFRFQYPQVRVTVAVGSSNSTVIAGFPITNNTVILVNGASNANFSVSGLPAGASVVLTDGNANALTATTQSTNLLLTLNTTNVPEGVYLFTLNVGGFDTNDLPITNSMPFVLQSAHIWNGNGLGAASFGVSNNWANASSWQGGVPAAGDDVVFSDSGAQTNATYATGISFTNVGIDSSMTVASIRFAQNTFTNLVSTNTEYHSLRLAPGTTLSVTGTNGFSLMRDYINDFGVAPDDTMGVNIFGTNATLLVSNSAANFGILLGNSEQPTLMMTNLGTLVASVNRMGIADYEIYPNYRAINAAYNAGRTATNYTGYPRHMFANIYLARSNYITAAYADPNNYTNEFTRGYAISLQNNEQSGNGSSTSTFFDLGITNVFLADSVCFIGSSSASGNGGGTKYNAYEKNATNPGTLFRGTNGTSRMSLFCVSDDGGTNQASSNVKATIDFTDAGGVGNETGQGYVNLLADRLYVSRDRTLIASNQSPNVQGDLTFGNGTVDVNTMILGFQEHSNKVDWTTIGGAQAYLNYCQGRLVLTNGGYSASTVKINQNLVLGFTADINPVGSAQQYNTYGQMTVYSNVTVLANNVICDGGLNYYDSNGRQNNINLNRGATLVISNTIGFPNPGANDFSAADPRGMYLDTLSMAGGSTLTVFMNPAQTNVFVRNLVTPGLIPSIIKVASLTGVSSFPVQLPVISYMGSASPFMNADVSALGAGYFGYVLNDIPNQSVDVYITTNPPNNLLWTGNVDNYWDTSTLNWVTVPGGLQTNFNLGDLVTFNDSSTTTNVYIPDVVVPGQTGVGVTISNSVEQYTFSGGTIAGTALVSKLGTNQMEFDATEQGPINLTAGTVVGSGQFGTTTVYTNVVLDYNGNISGGLTSTGLVTFGSGILTGPVSIQAGYLVNAGTISTTLGQLITMVPGTMITNLNGATINVGALPVNSSLVFSVPTGATLANFGLINLWQPKMDIQGLLYGNGTISYPNGGGLDSIANTTDPRLSIDSQGVISPGLTPYGSIGSMNIQCRFDFDGDPENGQSDGAGMSTVRIEVDFSNPQINDVLNVDRWNNDTGFLLMTNINPGAGVFTNGQVFQVFNNSNAGTPTNYQDTMGFCPAIIPFVPGPGLDWGVAFFNGNGIITVTNSPFVWDGSGTGSWDTNGSAGNWKNGQVYVDNQGSLFNDSASVAVVNLTTNVAPEGVPFFIVTNTDNLTFTNIIDYTNQPAFYPGIVVSNSAKNFVFAGQGHILGITGIYKTGPGTLTLLTSNAFTGNVIVDNGTLAISNFNAVSSIVSLGVIGSGAQENDIILDDGGILNYIGTANVQLSVGKGENMYLNPGGGVIGVASSTNQLAINKAVSGLGSLTKTGPGILQMQDSIDDYQGGTIVNAGALQLTAAAVGYAAITLNNTSALQLTNAITLTNAIVVSGPATSVQLLGNSTNIFTGNWSGGGTVTFSNANLCIFNGGLSNFSGTLSLGTSSGSFQFNSATNKNPCIGSAAATFNLGTGSAVLDNLYGGGLTYNLGALAGGPNTVLTGRITNSTAILGTTYSIGANGGSTTFSGRITNGLDTVSVVVVGGGLLLNGNSTYTGSTTVSNALLGGTGSIASPLTVKAGGTLSPGAPGIGTFTVSNSVTLGGSVLMELNRTNSPTTNDLLVVTGTLTGGGSLVVTNVGPDIINGSKFKLFSQPVTGFSSVTLPAANPSNTSVYSWNNTLATDGSIQLVTGGTSPVNTNSTNIVAKVSGSILTLSWPADHIGWRLQAQSNSLSVGLYTNWVTVAGSSATDSVVVPMDVNNGSVFYRLVYP